MCRERLQAHAASPQNFLSFPLPVAQRALQKAPLVLLLPRSGRVSRHLIAGMPINSAYMKFEIRLSREHRRPRDATARAGPFRLSAEEHESSRASLSTCEIAPTRICQGCGNWSSVGGHHKRSDIHDMASPFRCLGGFLRLAVQELAPPWQEHVAEKHQSLKRAVDSRLVVNFCSLQE